MIAAVKVRGNVDVAKPIKDTMRNLGLDKRNQIGLYEDSDSLRGMLDKAKDYIAYGQVSEETVEMLEDRYGDAESGNTISAKPPKKGFRNTRKNVNQGGSLGNHENIDDLIQRMV